MASNAFIFDLDGTLVDSEEQIAQALNQTRIEWQYEPFKREYVHSLLGVPAREFIRDMNLSMVDEHNFLSRFRQLLSIDVLKGNRLFPGVKEFIKELSGGDLSLGIATSKPSRLAVQVVENSLITGLFQHIQGTDGFPSKPDPEVILRCMSALKANRALMFGDRIEDMRAAVAAGATGVGIAQSFHTEQELLAAGATLVFESFVSAKENIQGIYSLL
jgi:phosphoglycolate phosphatase